MKYSKLIVGLGNPGNKYANNRHNIGRMVVDHWAEKSAAEWKSEKGLYWLSEIKSNKGTILLCKPDTYMNKSGEAVRKIIQKYHIEISDIIIIVDEYNFDLGKIQLKFEGSDGGHNGVASIIEELESTFFGRLRLGIGKNFAPGEMVEYVLSDFNNNEISDQQNMITKAIEALVYAAKNENSRACSDINSNKIWDVAKISPNRSLKKVTVYAASSTKIQSCFFDAANKLGKILADNQITVNYGGGRLGLMGALADSMLENNGKIIGIIPDFLNTIELGHKGLTYLQVVDSMHTRKTLLVNGSDAVIALPGGIGTLEELLEIITWKQLGFFPNPIVILNVNNYFDPLLAMLEKMIDEKFLRPKHADMWVVAEKPEQVMDLIHNSPKWDNDAIKFAQV